MGTNGSASISAKGNSKITIEDDILLSQGAYINFYDHSLIYAEGIVGGNVLLNWNTNNPKGEIKTSGSSELFVTGKLVAGPDVR